MKAVWFKKFCNESGLSNHRMVERGGNVKVGGRLYTSTALNDLVGQEVIVFIDPAEDMKRIVCYATDGTLLCSAFNSVKRG
ncbi:Mu transposase C-terminal domain-containing protein [Desulfuromonas acetoxidans]|uniref:Mu transposase C-terminal domain-containing protein n=1 Tax=Desulfuromonas acetoxidans TaxID=891 RepID=UPI0002FF3102|nr:Mu transposase C-terminal domain-containing protein [Desulfuromonas acetoxidans]MBF0647171.1 Mu transposase C-terminal domain-containing protein [Desulfuromonas acetoxidans]NVD26125.1 Mu transposase C-terminal domain-containing protein [Desulfuromonas acetoxidans]NVE17943.1 Mu transposase C-terminal domain-containing protein [Desulfuromonas acetoxidans]